MGASCKVKAKRLVEEQAEQWPKIEADLTERFGPVVASFKPRVWHEDIPAPGFDPLSGRWSLSVEIPDDVVAPLKAGVIRADRLDPLCDQVLGALDCMWTKFEALSNCNAQRFRTSEDVVVAIRNVYRLSLDSFEPRMEDWSIIRYCGVTVDPDTGCKFADRMSHLLTLESWPGQNGPR